MIAPEVGELHGVAFDLRPYQRELLIEALDGAIWQAQNAMRLSDRGSDDYAHEAIRRFAGLTRTAIGFSNEIQVEGKRLAEVTKRPQGERTDLLDNVQEVTAAPTGNSAAAGLRKLQKAEVAD